MLAFALLVGASASLKSNGLYTDKSEVAKADMQEALDAHAKTVDQLEKQGLGQWAKENPKTVAIMARMETTNKALKTNTRLQSQVQLDAGRLRITPVGEVLGHPTDAERQQCIEDRTTNDGKDFANGYSFNCAHKGDNMVDDNLIKTQSDCESAWTIRHRMDADRDAYGNTYQQDCSLRGEVQYCAWNKDSFVCPGNQGGRDCSSEGRCMPSGATNFVCPENKPILVDCKPREQGGQQDKFGDTTTDEDIKKGNGWGDDYDYTQGGKPGPARTNPQRTNHAGADSEGYTGDTVLGAR